MKARLRALLRALWRLARWGCEEKRGIHGETYRTPRLPSDPNPYLYYGRDR